MIHIITKHGSHNYGAMLQSWALMTTLKKEGIDCKILNYRTNKPKLLPQNTPVRQVVNGVYTGFFYKSVRSCFDKFEAFLGEYDLTQEYTKYNELLNIKEHPDAYITGSDQVWNPYALDKANFLDFAGDSSKRISYAASMGASGIPEHCKDSISYFIDNMDYISVREADAEENLKNLGGRNDINVNIDPVLLITKEEWKEFSEEYKLEKPYILCYFMYTTPWLNDFLKELYKTTGKEIVLVTVDPFRNIYSNKTIRDAGPKELLSLIIGADCVVSSSFHGVALSIANHKPFYALINPNMPARLSQILDVFGLQDRIITENAMPDFKDIDYVKVEEIRIKERNRSLDYLKGAISGTLEKPEKEKPVTVEGVGSRCTGCGSCKMACPTDAIEMVEDEEGFKYPKINADKCIKCGLCLKKCHVFTKNPDIKTLDNYFYGKHNDESVRLESSSGGVFTALADKVLESGGVVFGAVFDSVTKKVVHTSTDQCDMSSIRRSKYVESDMDGILPQIKEALNADRKVLFCGTPCQCSGVRRCFGNDNNLLICDFLCHGVPSSKVFRDYLCYLEDKNKDKIVDYRFRTKQFGWAQYGVEIDYEKSKQTSTVGRCEWIYVAGMLDDLFLRKSCYTCDKAISHEADITIGDFWGVFKFKPELNDDKGISVVVSNTQKGEDAILSIKDAFPIEKIDRKDMEYALKPKKNASFLARRNRLFKEYNEIGCKAFIDKYYKRRLAVNKIKFALRKVLK